jgi:hypothetical protein
LLEYLIIIIYDPFDRIFLLGYRDFHDTVPSLVHWNLKIFITSFIIQKDESIIDYDLANNINEFKYN